MTPDPDRAIRIAVLASGQGSTLQAILDRIIAGRLAALVQLVISDEPAAAALGRARGAGVPTRVIAPTAFPDRAAWTAALASALQQSDVELVVLAGFMRIVGPGLLKAFPGRVLNIHPSLLPSYRGLNTYRRVLASGDSEHGTSVHFVTPELDGGPVIAQVALPIAHDDDELSLRKRVQAQERWLYPEVISWFASGRLAMRNDGVWLDGKQLTQAVRLAPDEAQMAGAGLA